MRILFPPPASWHQPAFKPSERTILHNIVAFEPTDAKLDDVTILVASCDKYSPLWPTFFSCLFRYWPSLKTHNAHVPIILVSEKESWPDARVTCMQTQEDDGWSTAMLTGIEQHVQTRFMMILHDDYFLCRGVDEKRLDAVLSAMRQQPIAHCQVGDYSLITTTYGGLPGAHIKDMSHNYRISSQPCFWQTQDFVALIRKGESAWQAETEGTKRSRPYEQETGKKFLFLTGEPPVLHLNAVNLGKMEACVAQWVKRKGLPAVPPDAFPLKSKGYARLRAEPYAVAILQAHQCLA